MGLECCMILLDNSSYAVNGDYGSSTRWASQEDACRVLFNSKTGSNPETSVGLMTLAGTGPTVLVSPTQEFGKIATALHGIKMHGSSDVLTGINVAQLALKHRQNKNQRQRIVVFVGSPVEELSAPDLVKLGKKLKKNNVAVDVVSFGEEAENEDKLRQFIDAVNSSDNSHLVTIPPGTVLISDMIISSAMLAEDGVLPHAGGSGVAGGANGEDGEMGVDPNLDPELAMALRMSLEEERARQAAAQRAQEQQAQAQAQAPAPGQANASTSASAASTSMLDVDGNAAAPPLPPALAEVAGSGPATAQVVKDASSAQKSASASAAAAPSAAAAEVEDVSMTEEDELAMALALSRGGEDTDMQDHDDNDDDDNNDEDDEYDDVGEDEGMTEEEAIARAIALSMGDGQGRQSHPEKRSE